MEIKSELEQFLASHSSEGQVDSHGSFTVGGKEALRKIAEFQLPFEGAWAVKILQSIVAGGTSTPIRVDLTITEIRFFFGGAGYTLSEFEEAFYTPEPSSNRALIHLLSGLWPVALKERWGFQIAFPRQSETVIWDGQNLHRVSSSLARDCACISVAPLQSRSALSWVAGFAMSGSRNAELLLVFGLYCYTCPVPLTVDGRRVDSLQSSRSHGWGKQTYPLSMGYAEAALPPFGLAPGTFGRVTEPLKLNQNLFENEVGGGWKRVGQERWRALKPRETASLAYLLCMNMKAVETGSGMSWKDSHGPSTIYWVLDGALVADEPLFDKRSHCSVGCFLSAEGLQTDLSTFGLLQSPEREERVNLAREVLLAKLESAIEDGDFDGMFKPRSGFQRIGGRTLVVLGLALAWTMPVPGLIGAAAGEYVFRRAASRGRVGFVELRASLEELSGRIRSRLAEAS